MKNKTKKEVTVKKITVMVENEHIQDVILHFRVDEKYGLSIDLRNIKYDIPVDILEKGIAGVRKIIK